MCVISHYGTYCKQVWRLNTTKIKYGVNINVVLNIIIIKYAAATDTLLINNYMYLHDVICRSETLQPFDQECDSYLLIYEKCVYTSWIIRYIYIGIWRCEKYLNSIAILSILFFPYLCTAYTNILYVSQSRQFSLLEYGC